MIWARHTASKTKLDKILEADLVEKTKKGNEAAAQALAYANDTGKTTIVHVVWWSDAEAIAEKVDLAKELGIAGVAIFKIDGGEDKNIWKLF